MSSKWGKLPDPAGGSSHNQEEDERAYPMFKAFEEYVRRSFEGCVINSGVYCASYEEAADGIEVKMGAVQRTNSEYRERLEAFQGAGHVETFSEFDETQNREVYTVYLEWPTSLPSVTRMFSAPRRRTKLYDQPRMIILAMAATLFVSTLSTTGEQWLLLATRIGL